MFIPKVRKIQNKNGTISYRIMITNRITHFKESKTFTTPQLCRDWASRRLKEIEQEAIYGAKAEYTIGEIIEKYNEIYQKENYILDLIARYPIAKIPLNKLKPKDIIDHARFRNQECKPQTVNMDIVSLKSVIKSMSISLGFSFDFGIIDSAREILWKEKLIKHSEERDRTATFEELLKVSRFFKQMRRSTLPLIDILWFSVYSTRRASEVERIRWEDLNEKNRTCRLYDVKHPTRKIGNNKTFKMTESAWRIIQRQPRTSEYIFPYSLKTVSDYFQRACKYYEIKDLRYHDLRHTGVTFLFKKGYQIHEVQHFSLHSSWSCLQIYTNLRAEDIPDR